MKKEDFNKLNAKDQIEYINKKLESKTLTEVCKEINISRSTVRDRFFKHGYLYNKDQNKYLYLEANKEPKKEKECKDNTKALEERIKALESKIEAIEQRLNSSPEQINIKNFDGKTVSRCYRLYEEVQKEFSKFCKKNSNYKVQDILSIALEEYMEKYE